MGGVADGADVVAEVLAVLAGRDQLSSGPYELYCVGVKEVMS